MRRPSSHIHHCSVRDGFTDIFGIQANARAARLDIFVNIGGLTDPGLYHTQVDAAEEWSNRKDVLRGSDCNDLLYGEKGNDSLFGGGGNDRIFGGDGDDMLYGGSGKDEVSGGNGKDVINGGPGKDVLNGGKGRDVCTLTRGDKSSGCEKKKRAS